MLCVAKIYWLQHNSIGSFQICYNISLHTCDLAELRIIENLC